MTYIAAVRGYTYWRKPAQYDPALAALIFFLWTRSAQTDDTGAVARFVRCHTISAELLADHAEWSKAPSSAAKTWMLATPPADALTKWTGITNLRLFAANFGPNISSAQIDAAIADWVANGSPQPTWDNWVVPDATGYGAVVGMPGG